MVLVRVVGDVPFSVVATLAAAETLETLEQVLRWGAAIVEVIVQDEYTHDVVCGGPAFLVFDTT